MVERSSMVYLTKSQRDSKALFLHFIRDLRTELQRKSEILKRSLYSDLCMFLLTVHAMH